LSVDFQARRAVVTTRGAAAEQVWLLAGQRAG
jgi:hypothetical protein